MEVYQDRKASYTIQNILQVQHYGSAANAFYKILAPVQVTLEYCSGLSDDDHYNILMVSTADCWFRGEKNDELFRSMNTLTPHRHDFFELLIVLEGEILQQIEGKEYLYRAGTCCLINRNILHTEKFTGRAKICFIGLSVDCIRDLLDTAPSLYFAQERALQGNPVLQFMQKNMNSEIVKEYQDLFPTYESRTGPEQLPTLTSQLIDTLLRPGPGATYRIKGTLSELFAYLGSEFYVTPVRLRASADSLLFLRIQRLLEDTNGRLPRAELASMLHYNGSYLNEVVQHHTGLCLFDYGMTFCFKKAEQLLLGTELSVSEIVTRLNFSNRTHFYALFRKQYGLSPQEYRRQKRTAPAEQRAP